MRPIPKKTVIITAGGTGGHVFPAKAIFNALSNNNLYETVFLSRCSKQQNFLQIDPLKRKNISSAPFVKSPFKLMLNSIKILKGFFQTLFFFRKVKPNLIISFGSYVTFPVLLAARVLKIPYVLHEQNLLPGKVNLLFSRRAKITGVFFEKTDVYLKGETTLVDMPLTILKNKRDKSSACNYFNLNSNLFTILIFGGSQGALFLNKIFLQIINCLKKEISFQVIHIVGLYDDVDFVTSQYQKENIPHYVTRFEKNMGYAWASADLAITRAGAMTIAEQIEMNVPSILIPYPFATDNHQKYNALFMEQDVKGSLMIEQKELNSEILLSLLHSFFTDSFKQLKEMRANISKYKKSEFRKDFIEVISQILEQS